VRLQIVVERLVAGEQAEGHAVVREARALARALFEAVGDGLVDLRRALFHARDDLVEDAIGGALRRCHRELQPELGEGEEAIDEVLQIVDVRRGDDAVDGEIGHAPVQELDGLHPLLEGVGAHHRAVHLGRAAVQRHVHVAQAAWIDQLVHDVRVREQQAVGDEAEVQAELGDAARPLQELGADGRLTAGEDDHRVAEALGAIDLPVDPLLGVVEVAHVVRVAKGAVLVAPVPDLDQRLHDP
jgi:hypothetical protein